VGRLQHRWQGGGGKREEGWEGWEAEEVAGGFGGWGMSRSATVTHTHHTHILFVCRHNAVQSCQMKTFSCALVAVSSLPHGHGQGDRGVHTSGSGLRRGRRPAGGSGAEGLRFRVRMIGGAWWRLGRALAAPPDTRNVAQFASGARALHVNGSSDQVGAIWQLWRRISD
jgi:hypothetical protein